VQEKLSKKDKVYLEILLAKIRVCKVYKPKFGQRDAVDLAQFRALYGADPLYSWLGLDTPLLYAAHKAAGGMTSLYRQVGNGLEMVFRRILCDQLGLTSEQSAWAYTVALAGKKKPKKLTLDGRIVLADVKNPVARERIRKWLIAAAKKLGVDPGIASALKGLVFEVRQGYKSKDSKRQNADISNASTAYTQGYLPVAMILSTQIDEDVADRYTSEKWLLLRGFESTDSLTSTYAFLSDVIGYDLGAMLKKNSAVLKSTVNEVLAALLTPTEPSGAVVPSKDKALEIDETEFLELSDDTDSD
jgi:hypothetical protein